jgi:hypothetical protein
MVRPNKNQDVQSEIKKLIPGGVLTLNFNDPNGVLKDVDATNVWGIKVKTDSTIGIKK